MAAVLRKGRPCKAAPPVTKGSVGASPWMSGDLYDFKDLGMRSTYYAFGKPAAATLAEAAEQPVFRFQF